MSAPIVLLLDDDVKLLSFLGALLEGAGCQVRKTTTVSEAVSQLSPAPDVALVDLFLEGDAGDTLSNNFVRDYLIARKIPYGRISSATHLLPEDRKGSLVYDKTELRNNPVQFIREFMLTFDFARRSH